MSALICIYFICAFSLMIYGINAHILLYLFKNKYFQKVDEDKKFLKTFYSSQNSHGLGEALNPPVVTTQLPVYNEIHVVERLIDAVASFQYPEGRHEIQVLDDSTDGSYEVISKKVLKLQAEGVDIHHIIRDDRTGFKAGALKNGLRFAKGDLIAVFDADFLPEPDFLLKSVPFFSQDQRLGLVQARWGHLNENESWLTRLQAMGINSHFMIEQGARNSGDLFMNFNGTAGLIRKSAIIDAGNWQGDTLTEDMDLSYRMQLCGWHCKYLLDLVAPAEIPGDLNSFKAQQFRWAKGSTQTAMKLLPQIFRSSARPFKKIQAFLHMTHYFIHPLMLILAILAPVLLLNKSSPLSGSVLLLFGVFLLISCTGPSRIYFVAEKCIGRSPLTTAIRLPLMICFGCGLAINNSRAVLEAFLGYRSDFIRTPKRGRAKVRLYRSEKNPLVPLEFLVGLWCLYGVFLYFSSYHFLIGHFMVIYAIGFLTIAITSWRHQLHRESTS